MRKMNKIAGLLLAMFLLCLAGCGESKPDNDNPDGHGNPTIPVTGPQQFQLTGVDSALQIKFTKVADFQDIEAKYDLKYGTVNNINSAASLGRNVLKVGGLLVSGEITGLTNGVTYYVWINAVFGTRESAYHMETGVPVYPPPVPYNVTAIPGERLIEVTWDALEDVECPAFSYEVALSTGVNPNAGNAVRRTTTEPRYMITVADLDGNPPVNGTAYNIWVRASNTDGNSEYSEPVNATPRPATSVPATPGTLTVEPGKKRLKVTWDAVPGAASYQLYYSTSNNAATATLASEVIPASGTVSATIANLENGTAHYVWVRARNSRGTSGYSPAGTGTPADAAVPVNFMNYNFQLGEATAEYIFAELRPFSPFTRGSSQGPWDRLTRGKETPIGNLFTDGVLWYLNVFTEDPGKKVDFVFLNGGYIDNAMKQGSISVATVAGAVASGSREDTITLLSMKGSDIKLLFADAADVHHNGTGSGSTGPWANVSKEVNYTIVYDYVTADIMSMPQASISDSGEYTGFFHGVIKPGTLKLNGADFEDNKTYRIATTDYQADGIEYLRMSTAGFDREDTFIPFWHAVSEYIYDSGSITPAIDGRIRLEGGVPNGPLGVPEGYNRYCPAGSTYDPVDGCIF